MKLELQKKRKFIGFRVEAKLLERFDEKARKVNRSRSVVLRHLIRQFAEGST